MIQRQEADVWQLEVGDFISRRQLHNRLGGNREARISPSASSPNIFVFSEPRSAIRHGYMDHWDGEVFHFYGMGRRGDQKLSVSNRSLYEHDVDGRSIRLFQGTEKAVRYLGEFRLDSNEPIYWTRAPQLGSAKLRWVIVFRLVPMDYKAQRAPREPFALSTPYRRAVVKRRRTPSPFSVDPDVIDRVTEAHSRLQNQLAAFVRGKGASIYSPGPLDPEFDLAWKRRGRWWVAEVKSLSVGNEMKQLRLGFGQVLHYQDVLRRSTLEVAAVLFVEREPSDQYWVQLCLDHGVSLVWPGTLTQRILNR